MSLGRDERGVVIILFALLLPVLLIVAALVVDYAGIASTAYRGPFRDLTEMQLVADTAARAGASVSLLRDSTPLLAENEAKAVASQNNYGTDSLRNIVLDVNTGTDITFGAYIGRLDAVEVVITQTNYKFPLFSSYLGFGDGVTLRARAVAVGLGPCIVSLNSNQRAQVGIDFSGAKTSIAATCGLYSNYPGDKSIKVGAATVCADSVMTVGSVFGTISGCEGSSTTPAIVQSNTSPYPDPFSNLDFTAPAGPIYDSYKKYKSTYTSWNDVLELSPGVYPNGIKFTANAHKFQAGTYYFPPDQELTTGAGAGNIDGTAGVTFVFEQAKSNNKGGYSFNSPVSLTAPSSGEFQGVIIASKGNMQNQGFNSTQAEPILDGAIYAPNSTVNFNAPMSTGTKCLVIIADSVSFAGGTIQGKGCVPPAMNLSLFNSSRLVE